MADGSLRPDSTARRSDRKKRRRGMRSSPGPTEPASPQDLQALSSLKQHIDDRLAAHKQEVAEMLERTEALLAAHKQEVAEMLEKSAARLALKQREAAKMLDESEARILDSAQRDMELHLEFWGRRIEDRVREDIEKAADGIRQDLTTNVTTVVTVSRNPWS